MSFEMTSKMSNTKITFLGKNDFHIIQSQNHSYQNTFSNFTIWKFFRNHNLQEKMAETQNLER